MPDVRLRDYAARRRQLAELLQSAMHLAIEEGDEEAQRRARQLLSNLAEDRFQLAVVGQFSRGKSTLMNAILGGTYLPTGALPMTSVVTTVRYGSKVRVEVHPAGEGLPIGTTLTDLPRYISESSPERERLRIVAADIQLPAEILRLGFSFVDTPGIGSAVEANTRTTRRYLPDADAVIFVTSAESPLTADEMDLYARVCRHRRRFFLVLNKIDLVDAADVPRLVSFVREQLSAEGEALEPPVFAISARLALEGRESHDTPRVEASGVVPLEEELVRFLTTDKSRELLVRTADRAREMVLRQRLEPALRLRLGPKGIDPKLRPALERRVDELCEAEQREAHGLATTLNETLRARLEEHVPRWSEELESRLLPAALAAAAESATRRPFGITQPEVRRDFDRRADQALEAWGSEWAEEVRRAVAELALPTLTALARGRASITDMLLAVLGAEPSAGPAPSGGPLDAPARLLAIERPRPRLAGTLPWWVIVAPTAWSRHAVGRSVAAGLRTGITQSLEEATKLAVDGAVEWAEALGVRAQRETRNAAQDLQQRLTSVDRTLDLSRFDAVLERLDAFTSDLEQPVVEGQSASALSSNPVSATEPCPICRELEQVLTNYLAAAQFDLLHHDDRRAAHANGGGFCPLHTWQYAQLASPLGVATAYAPVAERAATLLRRVVAGTPDQDLSSGWLAEVVLDRDRCPACMALAGAERAAIASLLADRRWQNDRSATPALCAPHIAAVVNAQPPPEVAHRLESALTAFFERTAEDMRGYALKRDSFRRELITDEESAAAMRVLGRLAGSPALVRPPSGGDEI